MIFGYDANGNLKNHCPDCKTGLLNIKTGKFGMFIACSNYPDCKHTERILDNNENKEQNEMQEKFENRILGKMDGKNVYLKKGPYGLYAQLGEDKENPKRVSLKKVQNPDEVTLESVEAGLSLPKTIGVHPDNGEEIKVNIGPYGPYVMWNKNFFSIKQCAIEDVDLEKALEIIKTEGEKKKSKK
jgi:DNA topoisomerase-1